MLAASPPVPAAVLGLGMGGGGIFELSGGNVEVVGGNLVGRSGGEEFVDGSGGLGGSIRSLVESLGLTNVGSGVACTGGCGTSSRSATCIVRLYMRGIGYCEIMYEEIVRKS